MGILAAAKYNYVSLRVTRSFFNEPIFLDSWKHNNGCNPWSYRSLEKAFWERDQNERKKTAFQLMVQQ